MQVFIVRKFPVKFGALFLPTLSCCDVMFFESHV